VIDDEWGGENGSEVVRASGGGVFGVRMRDYGDWTY
jgi:hypothetical protein